ncbi:MAG: Maf family nucleotide pyrophosphatase [Lachnospiraceae bacterium]|nr:Maf family nucleotide pyrophosphatase [Lachnospiraceae bacterium]
MKTEKLYYKDPMTETFDAKVLACTEIENKKGFYSLILDKTAFFPEGGGQECDTGMICAEGITATVTYVSEDAEGSIIHTVDRQFEVGMTVKGTLDWDKRFSNMQHHTGEHIMSGLIKKYFDKNNVGFHLHSENAVFDIDGTFSQEDLSFLEDKANKAVTADIVVNTKFISKDELINIPCRSKFYDTAAPGEERTATTLLPLPDEIRIVNIEGTDTCACCAPHVKSTGQIGMIKIMSAEHFRGGTRFTIVCGDAALKAMRRLRNDELKIMHMLSAKQGETPDKVASLQEALQTAKQSSYAKDETIADILMQSAAAENKRIFFCPDIDMNKARKCVNELTGHASNAKVSERSYPPVFFFIGSDKDGYRFIIGGGSDARKTLELLKEKLDIKGGGSVEMVSGTTTASRSSIEAAISISVTDICGPRMILASASPRRKEILSKLKIPFEVIVSGADENSSTKEPCALVKELSYIKAKDVFEKFTNNESVLVIGSDTVVDLDGTILGKPRDSAVAAEMLRSLSGRSHKVHTGITVIVRTDDGKISEFNESETSIVNVDPLTDKEITDYINSGEPFDKAGSYAVQGLFAPYISSIEGDYYNIVGLPLRRLYRIIKTFYS